MKINIDQDILALQPALTAFRRDIHAHPELAFQELHTAEAVASRLESWGLQVTRGVGRTGVVASLRAGALGNSQEAGHAIGLRADMDALPIEEGNDFAHRSQHSGRMHACGHDGHTTMLLGAAQYLAQTRDFNGVVHFVFQPAEEHEGGGKAMIDDGLFQRWPMRSIFGMHNWPGLPVGEFAAMPGPMMASADQFDIQITGHGAHAAMPHNGIDPIMVGAALVQALQTLVSRNTHPVDAAVLSVTQFHAGDAYNVIPGQAQLRGTVRAFKPAVQDLIETGMQRICAGVAQSYGARIALNYQRGYPPTVNWPQQTNEACEVIESLVGADRLHRDLMPTMGAEDFAFMLQEKPGCYVWIGNGPGEGGCMLHNPLYDFNDDIIALGVAYWAGLVRHLLPTS